MREMPAWCGILEYIESLNETASRLIFEMLHGMKPY
jgi:hypothetical protein